MKNSLGENLTVTIFGESHGPMEGTLGAIEAGGMSITRGKG